MDNLDEEDFVFSPDHNSAGNEPVDQFHMYQTIDSHKKKPHTNNFLETIKESSREVSPPVAEFTEATWPSEDFQLATATPQWKKLMQRGQNLSNLQSEF